MAFSDLLTKQQDVEVLPIFCSSPTKEKYVYQDSSGATKTAEELNIDEMGFLEIAKGFTSDKALVLQDINYIVNWIFRKLEYVNRPQAFLKTDLPNASANIGLIALVTDENCLAISDGTNWKKITIGSNV
jgi:hypothetical protein